MTVLSLFDGISCGQLALQRAGICVDKYYASEIDSDAIKVTQKHFPNTIQLGDVTKINAKDLGVVDLLIGGSPCQGFSTSGKRLNFDDPRSKLFFDFVRLVKTCKPKKFLLENVKMQQKYVNIISTFLGVPPIRINSNLVSAQNRDRYYWTNIDNVEPPIDKKIKLRDILQFDGTNQGITQSECINKATIVGRRLNAFGCREDYNKQVPITQCLEVRATNVEKSNCLTTVAKDNVLTSLPIGRHPDCYKRNLNFRYYTLVECCRLQTLPDDYFQGLVSDTKALKLLGNAWTVDIVAHIFSYLKNLGD